MARLRKVKPEWNPQEHPGIAVGEIIEFVGPHEQLVREGSAQLVDEAGNTLPLPGTVFNCPMPGCLYHTESTIMYTDHVIEAHKPATKAEVKVEAKEEPKLAPKKEKTPEERKAFAEKMAAAKAKKKAEREAQAKVESVVEGAKA